MSAEPEQGEQDMVRRPTSGRVFSSEHRVRLADVSPRGRMRLDAIARHLQDVATDDSRDAGLAGADGWVVRRTTVAVRRFPVHQQRIDLATWCGAIGSHWAERRTQVTDADHGDVLIDAATVWVRVDLATMRPARVGPDFRALYGETAGDRTVSARLRHGPPPALDRVGVEQAGVEQAGVTVQPWSLRFSDLDALGHVNNAAGWETVEEVLTAHRDLRAGVGSGAVLVAEVEHPRALEPGADVTVVSQRSGDAVAVWVIADSHPALTAQIHRET